MAASRAGLMVGSRPRRKLRKIAAPFVVAAPTGARIRTRLRPSPDEEAVLRAVCAYLGSLASADLAARVRLGGGDPQRGRRKQALTAVSSSRWAGALTRTSDDQYRLGLRGLRVERSSLVRRVRRIRQRLGVGVGRNTGQVRGYASVQERYAKQVRLQVLHARLVAVERQLAVGRPSIVRGGKRLAGKRHNLDVAGLTQAEWAMRWRAARWFCTADGEAGKKYGNETIRVTPDGRLSIRLPEPLTQLANDGKTRYTFATTVAFNHRVGDWLDRVTNHRAIRYDITLDPANGRWYVDASWGGTQGVAPTVAQATAGRVLAVDVNADHLAAWVVDAAGNPVGSPHTITLSLAGQVASTRDAWLREAISRLLDVARDHACPTVVIENLGFVDARQDGREAMGRGRRGKAFRRMITNIPTGKFRDRLAGLAATRGITIVAVDPAYTSRWGAQHWQQPLLSTATTTISRHHAAALVIGRRAHGYGARRHATVASGVPVARPADRRRRATARAGRTPPAAASAGRAAPPVRPTRSPPCGAEDGNSPAGKDGTHGPKTVRGPSEQDSLLLTT